MQAALLEKASVRVTAGSAPVADSSCKPELSTAHSAARQTSQRQDEMSSTELHYRSALITE
jgi:hypothetical protein